MIRFFWFTLIGALTCLLCLGIAAFARVQFDIRVSVQQTSFSVGTDIPVEITLTNISKEVLEVTYSGVPAVDFMPIVLRSNGSSAAPLEPLMKAVNPEVINGGATTDRLEPKEMVNERMIVNRLFDMKEPGRYVVQVSRRAANGSRQSTLTINKSTISGNTVSIDCITRPFCITWGGGIFTDGPLTINKSTISGNTVQCIGHHCITSGGGIMAHGAHGATVTVNNSTLSGNNAGNGGGGGIANYRPAPATVTISNSTLSGNYAGGGGGFYSKP